VVLFNLPEDEIASVIFGFKKHVIFINHIEINKPTLEDVFLAMVQKQQESRQ
jgi:ABC-type uncharacterized transport system ATPase subunit